MARKKIEPKKKIGKKKICLALQGGGAHGAFTWGVLDRLLEEDDLEIEGVTGTSAGGMNALCLAQGLGSKGLGSQHNDITPKEAARKLLETFWMNLSTLGQNNFLNTPGLADQVMGNHTMGYSLGYLTFQYLRAFLSPYDFNPFNVNPLKDFISEIFDFEKIRKQKACKTYLCATHVNTGKIRIFKTKEITEDVLLATACVPYLHHAVEIQGEHYWDGGYVGNPVLYPLLYDCESPNIVLVKLTPSVRKNIPRTSSEIQNRLFEITNNTTILREIRVVNFITKLIDDGALDATQHKRSHIFTIEDNEAFEQLERSSTLNISEEFLRHLFEKGRQAGSAWIDENMDTLSTTITKSDHLKYLDYDWNEYDFYKK